MAFIIIFVALMVERFFDWSHLRHWRWFRKGLAWLNKSLSTWPGYLILAIAVLPPVFLVACLNYCVTGWLYGLVKLIFGILILILCFGPRNFWAEAYACIAALRGTDLQLAMERAKAAFGVTVFDDAQAFHRAFTNALFCAIEQRIFSVLFWFFILGPAGALLYRLIDLCRSSSLGLARSADSLIALFDWLPVRCFTLFFALGGHFTHVIVHWKQTVFAAPKMNAAVLSECGIAALDVLEAKRIPEDGLAEKETISLLDRVFVIILVLLAILVLV